MSILLLFKFWKPLKKKISYKEVEMALVGNHGSFTWGLDAQIRVQ